MMIIYTRKFKSRGHMFTGIRLYFEFYFYVHFTNYGPCIQMGYHTRDGCLYHPITSLFQAKTK